jgi:SAM-dependent methyltransferase
VGALRRRLAGLPSKLPKFLPFLRPSFARQCVQSVAGKRVLEVGGPSGVFRDDSFIPVYMALAGLDGCNFGSATMWEGSLQEGQTYQFMNGRDPGYQYLLEATDLSRIESGAYEAVISSHMLEHSADPIKALLEWTRVIGSGGTVLLVLPHKDGTFDRRRPRTTLSHMREDYEKGVGEDDMTHVPEILELHDLTRDPPAGDLELFRTRCLDNFNNRGMHHHVFDLRTAVELVDHVGLQILVAETARPFHIVILARKQEGADNSAFLASDSPSFAHSRFPTDRRLARE